MKSVLRFFSIFGLFFLLLACSAVFAQDLIITKPRLTTGGKTLTLLSGGSGAYVCFELENTGTRDRYLTVTIRSDAAKGEEEYFSAEFFAPAKSVQQCQFPLQYDGSRTYTISANGAAQIPDNELAVFSGMQSPLLHLTVTDEVYFSGVTSVTDYGNLAGFPNRCAVERIPGCELPMASLQLESYRAILLYKTDFGKWHAKSFDAVVEYVKNGGTLCFGTPQDVYNALMTPLAMLVPVKAFEPGRKKETAANNVLRLKKKAAVSLTVVPMVPVDGAKTMRSSGFLEKRYGKGVVRVSSFDIWQSAGTLDEAGYGTELNAFLDGDPIPQRPIVYTHTRLEHNSLGYFEFPSGNRLLAVLIFLCGGILVLCILENLLRLILGGNLKKIYGYAAVLLWSAAVLLLGSINGGKLFEWIPLPGANAENQQISGHDNK